MNDFRLFDNNTKRCLTDIKIRKKYNFMQMNLFYDKNTIYTHADLLNVNGIEVSRFQ